jgi:hypothetical protein
MVQRPGLNRCCLFQGCWILSCASRRTEQHGLKWTIAGCLSRRNGHKCATTVNNSHLIPSRDGSAKAWSGELLIWLRCGGKRSAGFQVPLA